MITNLTEEAKTILDRLTPAEKEVIWNLVAPPPSQRARNASRRDLTAYLVERLTPVEYMRRVTLYRDLLNLVLDDMEVNNTPNEMYDLLGEVAWLNCHENDRPLAVMMALKKLNASMNFKNIISLELDRTTKKRKKSVPTVMETEYLDDLEENNSNGEVSEGYFDDLEEEVTEAGAFFDKMMIEDGSELPM